MIRVIFADFLKLLQPPTAVRLAELELAAAERELLKAYSAREYAGSVAAYNEERIRRLSKFLRSQQETADEPN
jgi:hypothetical protein